MPPLPDRPVRHRGRARGGPGRARPPALPAGRRVGLDRGGDLAGRDDAGRHRRGRPPRRPPLPGPDRPDGAPAPGRPADPDRGRRGRRPRVRHRRGQGHPGPRPQRLRDRRAPRPARGRHPDRGGDRQRRGRPVRGPGPLRRPPRGQGRPGRAGPAGAGRGGAALGRPLLPLPDRGRAPPVAAVVRGHQAAGRPGHGGGPLRADPVRAGPLREDLLRLDGADPRLVRVPPALVGPPHPRLVLPGRARHRGPPGPRGLRRVRRRPAGPGRGRARHLVLERAVAVLDPRLARPDRRPGRLLPDVGAGHRVRHHLLLGGPDADVRLPLPAADALRGGGHPRDGPRRPGQEDVQVVRERDRPDRADGPLRHRRPPVRPDPRGQPGQRRAHGRGVGGGRPQLRQQALEPGPLRPVHRGGRQAPPRTPPNRARPSGWPTVGCCRDSSGPGRR